MKIVRDYSDQYDAMVERLTKQQAPLSDTSQKMAELVGELADVILSQYNKVPDLNFRDEIEKTYFGFLNNQARMIGGCAEMNCNEDTGITTLELRGKEFVIAVDGVVNDGYQWNRMVKQCESISVSAQNDHFVICIFYDWMKKEKVWDCSERIDSIRSQMRELRKNMSLEEYMA